jgi:hypothetical protein
MSRSLKLRFGILAVVLALCSFGAVPFASANQSASMKQSAGAPVQAQNQTGQSALKTIPPPPCTKYNPCRKAKKKYYRKHKGPNPERMAMARAKWKKYGKPIGCNTSWLGMFGCVAAAWQIGKGAWEYFTKERICTEWYVDTNPKHWYFSGGGQMWKPTYCTDWAGS